MRLIYPSKAARAADESGFTLIEILVVLVIIGILTTAVAINMMGRTSDARIIAAKSQVKEIELALKVYKLDTGSYPSTAAGLAALVVKPAEAVEVMWRGPYMDEIPKDPWGKPYTYTSPAQRSHAGYDVAALGRDNREGGTGEDADITNWQSTDGAQVQ